VLNAWWLYRGLRARGLYVPQARWRPFALRLAAATAFTTAVILIARPGDDWWVTNAAGALDTRWAAGIPLVSAVADAASSHWTEFRRIGTLGALFVLGGAAYLGVLYGFGFRLRDVKR